ncbi:hypothetical protein GCM10010289_74960 [Streptomyces violascens]|nr:hypothetical protein GCM10010289_74960 [Streptomyces violascens]
MQHLRGHYPENIGVGAAAAYLRSSPANQELTATAGAIAPRASLPFVIKGRGAAWEVWSSWLRSAWWSLVWV